MTITLEDFRKRYRVDAAKGHLIWRINWYTGRIGKRAGSYSKIGYRYVGIKGKKFPEHRVIYALHHGVWPLDGIVDHIDRDTSNNRPNNLRLTDRSGNARNAKLSAANTTGHRHIQRDRRNGKYLVSFRVDGRDYRSKGFRRMEHAIAERNELYARYSPDYLNKGADALEDWD